MPGHTFTQNGGKRLVKTTEGMFHVVFFALEFPDFSILTIFDL